VKVWDEPNGALLATIQSHQDLVSSVVFDPSGKHFISASKDRTVKVWDADGLSDVVFDPSGKRFISASKDRTVKVWYADGLSARVTSDFAFKGHSAGVLRATFSPDGQQVISASRDWTVKIWDAASGRELQVIREDVSPSLAVAFSPNGRFVAS